MNTKPRIEFVALSLASLLVTTPGLAQTPLNPPQPNLGSQSVPSANPGFQEGAIIPAGEMSLPPMGEPGKCYARVWEPPVYGTETEELIATEGSERIEIIPATYEWVEEKVLIRKAYEREQVIPATYDTITEQILVKPAMTKWEKGRGLVEKVDNFTGEIMCLKEYPAEYKTITKEILKTPMTISKVPVPAEYQTIKVQKLVTPSIEKRVAIPPQYQTVSKTVLRSQGRMAWKSVICETNAPRAVSLPKGVTAIHAQSKPSSLEPETSTTTNSAEKNWFFFWDYDELFDRGKWTPAQKR